MNYECISSFNLNGRHISRGTVISESAYRKLSSSQQSNFRRESSSSYSSTSVDDTIDTFILGYIIGNMFDSDSSSNFSSDSSDWGGFGGGDFGGGGSGGEW